MDTGSAILAVLHLHSYPGTRCLGPSWDGAPAALQSLLRGSGAQSVEERAGHLLACFASLTEAVPAIQGAVAGLRAHLGWAPTLGALPCQVALHAAQGSGPRLPLLDATSAVWRALRFEAYYVTDALRRRWERLAAGSDLPASFAPAPLGLHRLLLTHDRLADELFPERALPYLWGPTSCFYCGHTGHGASACPSRYLTADVHGLSEAAKLPVSDLVEAYRRTVGDPTELTRLVAASPDQAQLRKDPALAAAAAFFDIHRTSQLRFFLHFSVLGDGRWPGIRNVGRGAPPSGSSLSLAVDCLRAGRLSEAQTLLSDKRRMRNADRFCVEVALGFLAVESGDLHLAADRWAHARRDVAHRDERVYVNLLLSRVWELLGDCERAEAAVDEVLAARPECQEGHYRRAQLLVRAGNPFPAVARVRTLALGDPDYFALVLLDPSLGPAGPEMDRMLGEVLRDAANLAQTRLAEARDECERLAAWLEPEDPELSAHRESLGNLEEKADHLGYAGAIEAADRAQGVFLSCRQIRKRRLEQLRQTILKQGERWAKCHGIWGPYPHKRLFRVFGERLEAVRRDLQEAFPLVKAETTDEYRAAKERVQTAEKTLGELEVLVPDLVWAQGFFGFLRRFSVRLVLYETVLIPAVLFGLPLLSRALGVSESSLLGGSLSPQRGAVFLCGLLAPVTALAQAVRRR